jgi:hypothetical protein
MEAQNDNLTLLETKATALHNKIRKIRAQKQKILKHVMRSKYTFKNPKLQQYQDEIDETQR